MPNTKKTVPIKKKISNIETIIKKIPLFSTLASQQISTQKLAGQTNNNYLITINNKDKYILRLPRTASNAFINRDDEAYNAKVSENLSLSPQSVWREQDQNQKATGLSLTRYINYSRVAVISDFKEPAFLKRLAKNLQLLQNSKVRFKGLRDENQMAQSLTEYFDLCTPEQKQDLEEDYLKSLKLLKETNCQRAAVAAHIDLTLENILIQDDKIWLIDWEYSAMSSPFWDIATLCNAAELNEQAAKKLLSLVIETSNKHDFQRLKEYQFISRTLTHCWSAAISSSLSIRMT